MKKKKRKIRREKPNPRSGIRAGKAIIEAVKEQMRINEPPETKLNFDRLLVMGYPEEDVYKMLASALACEIYAVMKHKRSYNNTLYVSNLNKLPDMPWEK